MDIYDIWFSKVSLNCKEKMNLIKGYKSIKDIWRYIMEYGRSRFTIDKYKKITDIWDEQELTKEKIYIEKNNINCVSYYDNEYPKQLRDFDDSPIILFYKGDISKLNNKNNISIVGSRNSSNYGNKVAMTISEDLAFNDINIISGMARGIDTMAHKGALKAKGSTFAVLGCGVDVVYPRENIKIYNEIIETGCVLSEFPPGTQPLAWNFPVRNRIISALSDLVIVVEANERSGSLITVSNALNQGKDVMAVPGEIFSKSSIGSNRLIKDGAYPLTSIEDVYEMLHIVHNFSYKKNKNIEIKYKKVYDILSDVPMHINEIIKTTNIDIGYLHELLFEMHTMDIINCIDGSFYVKNFN